MASHSRYAVEARQEGIQLVGIGVGKKVNFDEINQIAGDPNLVYHVSNFDALGAITNQISALACDMPSGKNNNII